MGLPFSAFNKLGLPGLSSVTSGQVYERYFKGRGTGNFADFHIAYIDFCKDLNTVMPGQDFVTPTLEDIKAFYEDTWVKQKDEGQRKQEFIEFMKRDVREATVDDRYFIMAGLAVPAGVIIAKRHIESIPQVKKFKLQYVPNVVFVPVCTLLAIMGVTALQMGKKGKAKTP